MLNFSDTKIFKNLNEYDPMRVNVGLLLVFKLAQHFKFFDILEIGFHQGLTFATLLEANAVGSLTAVDKRLGLLLYEKFYKNTPTVENKEIQLLHTTSMDFNANGKKYDFINVDAGHSMPGVLNDLIKATELINRSGIIMIDDYEWTDVDYAIDELLKMNTGFVPFLMDNQAVFFHHKSHDAVEFLDVVCKNTFESFCYIEHTEYKNYSNVLKISALKGITTNNDVFSLICEKYKL
jgi:hypothetical protein